MGRSTKAFLTVAGGTVFIGTLIFAMSGFRHAVTYLVGVVMGVAGLYTLFWQVGSDTDGDE